MRLLRIRVYTRRPHVRDGGGCADCHRMSRSVISLHNLPLSAITPRCQPEWGAIFRLFEGRGERSVRHFHQPSKVLSLVCSFAIYCEMDTSLRPTGANGRQLSYCGMTLRLLIGRSFKWPRSFCNNKTSHHLCHPHWGRCFTQ